MGKKKRRFDLKSLFVSLIVVLCIIFIFSAVDYFIHSLSEKYSVPQRYFPNKIIYGTIIGFFAYLTFKKMDIFEKSFAFSIVVSLLLQARYFIEGYSLEFVFLFLIVHFIILLAVSFTIFKIATNIPRDINN